MIGRILEVLLFAATLVAVALGTAWVIEECRRVLSEPDEMPAKERARE